jgi:hypothetical protein
VIDDDKSEMNGIPSPQAKRSLDPSFHAKPEEKSNPLIAYASMALPEPGADAATCLARLYAAVEVDLRVSEKHRNELKHLQARIHAAQVREAHGRGSVPLHSTHRVDETALVALLAAYRSYLATSKRGSYRRSLFVSRGGRNWHPTQRPSQVGAEARASGEMLVDDALGMASISIISFSKELGYCNMDGLSRREFE